MIHYFMNYPEHFERIRREVDEVIAPASAVETIDQLERLPFLDAFRDEAMRLKPVPPAALLEPLEGVVILDHMIPKGTQMIMLLRHVAASDRHFGNARRFDLERWLRNCRLPARHPGPSIRSGAGRGSARGAISLCLRSAP